MKDREKSARKGTGKLRPVEVSFAFAVRDRHDEVHTFNVAVDLLQGELDLAVSFTGRDDECSMLPADLFQEVRAALDLVKAKVQPDDLVERDD